MQFVCLFSPSVTAMLYLFCFVEFYGGVFFACVTHDGTAAAPVGEFTHKALAVCLGCADGEYDDVGELFVGDVVSACTELVFDCTEKLVGDLDVPFAVEHHAIDTCGVDAFGDGFAVGAYKSARAELDTAEVACDDDAGVFEPAVFEDFEHGTACGARGLAVIVCFLDVVIQSYGVGGAVMRGVVMFFSDAGDEGCGFLFRFYGCYIGKESGALYDVGRFAVSLYGQIFVHDVTSLLLY